MFKSDSLLRPVPKVIRGELAGSLAELRPVPKVIQGERAGSLALAEARTQVIRGERAGSLASVLACDPNFSTWSYLRFCLHLL